MSVTYERTGGCMRVGNLNMSHLGKRVTLGNPLGGFISGKLTSMEFVWPELHMGKAVERRGIRLRISGWTVETAVEQEIEVIA